MHNTRSRKDNFPEEPAALGGSTLLSLSLFIILLAFFIVLTSISSYEETKVKQTFDLLDIAFSTKLDPSEYENNTANENLQYGKGSGDSLEDMQGVLRSILPGLDVALTDNPNGGKVMAVRMEKNRFDRLTPQLIPLFIRILNIKDGPQDYELAITSYVRDALGEDAELSYEVLQGYREELMEKGLAPNRIALSLDLGNPAMMMFQFDKKAASK